MHRWVGRVLIVQDNGSLVWCLGVGQWTGHVVFTMLSGVGLAVCNKPKAHTIHFQCAGTLIQPQRTCHNHNSAVY